MYEQLDLVSDSGHRFRIKYAEALSKMERMEEAAAEFEAGANLLREQGRMDDYIKVAERLLFHRPDVAVAREVALMYLERNDAKRALSKLQVCFQANPKDVATLELLARAFHLLGQHPKTISVYREIARIYQDGKKPAERERVLRKILELDPNDQEAKTALGGKPPAPDASSLFESSTIMAPPRPNTGTVGAVPKHTIEQAPVAPANTSALGDDDDDSVQELDLLEDDFDDAEIIIRLMPGRPKRLRPTSSSTTVRLPPAAPRPSRVTRARSNRPRPIDRSLRRALPRERRRPAQSTSRNPPKLRPRATRASGLTGDLARIERLMSKSSGSCASACWDQAQDSSGIVNQARGLHAGTSDAQRRRLP
ncbi:MAG: hypothetical protein H6726_26315 [Sandaracinaceae bacterium]|nr:hypothetical protein [Sandaracinaceae bacterium]